MQGTPKDRNGLFIQALKYASAGTLGAVSVYFLRELALLELSNSQAKMKEELLSLMGTGMNMVEDKIEPKVDQKLSSHLSRYDSQIAALEREIASLKKTNVARDAEIHHVIEESKGIYLRQMDQMRERCLRELRGSEDSCLRKLTETKDKCLDQMEQSVGAMNADIEQAIESSESTQAEVERLAKENKKLREEITRIKGWYGPHATKLFRNHRDIEKIKGMLNIKEEEGKEEESGVKEVKT